MRAVFADTSCWIAQTNENDEAHRKAQMLRFSPASLTVLTTASVLTEYLNYFAGWVRQFREDASANVIALFASSAVTVEPEAVETFSSGLQLYRQRLHKGYSLADCISMQIMRRETLTDALTSDRLFEQKGFRGLFRS